MTPKDVLKLCEEQQVQFVDLRFMDFPGLWQHTSVRWPSSRRTASNRGLRVRTESSHRGWQAINESTCSLGARRRDRPHRPLHAAHHAVCPESATCATAITKKEYSRDPRSIARKTMRYLQNRDRRRGNVRAGALEFFISTNAWYDQGDQLSPSTQVESRRASGAGTTRTRPPWLQGAAEGATSKRPDGHVQNIRSEMVATLIEMGIPSRRIPRGGHRAGSARSTCATRTCW